MQIKEIMRETEQVVLTSVVDMLDSHLSKAQIANILRERFGELEMEQEKEKEK